MVHELISWLQKPAVMWSLAAFSLFAVLASIVFVPRFLATLPRDYLQSGRPPERHHPALRVLRNLLGALLLVLGIAMLLLPGQGLLTLLVGLLLVDFPGKQRILRGLIGRPKVLSVVNKLRAHRGAAPLVA